MRRKSPRKSENETICGKKNEYFLVEIDKNSKDGQKILPVVGFESGLLLSEPRLLRITSILKKWDMTLINEASYLSEKSNIKLANESKRNQRIVFGWCCRNWILHVQRNIWSENKFLKFHFFRLWTKKIWLVLSKLHSMSLSWAKSFLEFINL